MDGFSTDTASPKSAAQVHNTSRGIRNAESMEACAASSMLASSTAAKAVSPNPQAWQAVEVATPGQSLDRTTKPWTKAAAH